MKPIADEIYNKVEYLPQHDDPTDVFHQVRKETTIKFTSDVYYGININDSNLRNNINITLKEYIEKEKRNKGYE